MTGTNGKPCHTASGPGHGARHVPEQLRLLSAACRKPPVEWEVNASRKAFPALTSR
jgi:hypothetical protein